MKDAREVAASEIQSLSLASCEHGRAAECLRCAPEFMDKIRGVLDRYEARILRAAGR